MGSGPGICADIYILRRGEEDKDTIYIYVRANGDDDEDASDHDINEMG